MRKSIIALVAIVFIMFSGVAFAGTDKDNGNVCQGSTCGGGGGTTVPTVVNVTALGGAGGSGTGIAQSSSNATGGNAVANGGSANSSAVGVGGVAVVTNKVDNKVTNINANLNSNSNKNTNNNTNTNNVKNNNANKQAQGQIQGQAQKQGQGQAQSVRNANTQGQNNAQTIAPIQTVITEAAPLAIPQINAGVTPILQGGKIGDMTADLPDFFGLKKLVKGEQIVKVVKVLNGGWFTKIRLEDVPGAILEGVTAGAKIRYSVWVKDGVTAVSVGGGAGVGQSVGANAQAGSIIPGWAASNANPVFVIFVYEVK